MDCVLKIKCPSEEPGFVEYKRAFAVEGTIESDSEIPENSLLRIELYDEIGNVVRKVHCDSKNKKCLSSYPGLTIYEKTLDPDRSGMQNFGFPPLMVDDIENPEASIKNAEIKAWYSDKEFKAIIISATDISNGAIFDDGMNFTDANGNPFSTIPMGNYTVRVTLQQNSEIFASCEKKIRIARRKDQLICRFNPLSHKLRMAEWCREMGFAIITDLLPGYLDAYLGKWFYHMGLLKMYRANDICLFEDVCTRMFVYLVDETSTSYETELAYLQTIKAISDKSKFIAYHYDIGEAEIGKGRAYEQKAKILQFKDDEFLALCRFDILNDNHQNNNYFLDERAVDDVRIDFENLVLPAGRKVALMGVMKPWQMNSEDFVLRENNTYKIKNSPAKIRYTLNIEGEIVSFEKDVNMERTGDHSIGKSVFEFYNDFEIKEEWKNKKADAELVCIDRYGNETPARAKFCFIVE